MTAILYLTSLEPPAAAFLGVYRLRSGGHLSSQWPSHGHLLILQLEFITRNLAAVLALDVVVGFKLMLDAV
jgi:hypothetical protein